MERRFRSDLGGLVDPRRAPPPLNWRQESPERLRSDLRKMIEIRYAEEAIAELIQGGDVRCPCHLGIGQEAVPVGISRYLRPSDRVFGAHRSHSHYLALGGGLDALFAEVLGKASGASRGMGGSMHLYAGDVGFQGSVPIVAATIPIAVGAALAAKMDRRGAVAVSYFGDGAAEEGALHESLNLASVLALPVLFVCENNLYSSHLDIQLRQPSDRVARFADAHCMDVRVVDGNDLPAVADAARELLELCRDGRGPGFLEAVTYRWRGHVGPDENIDVGLRRKADDLAAWKRLDPVQRVVEALFAAAWLSTGEWASMQQDVRAEIAAAVARAQAAPFPPVAALLDLVYAG